MPWRFERTKQTTFFIFDVYIPCFLIVLCWVSMIIGNCFLKKKAWFNKYETKIWNFTHKIHEVSIMYFVMAFILEFMYFTPNSMTRIVSLSICIAFNIYFVAYELYVYRDMLKYPLAKIGNKHYEYYLTRYGSFLKNIRFEEYDVILYFNSDKR